ncbi:MAG: MFS transporter [Candidatus Coatesbacteria bacterium]|nr:MAG: MFS transporter [Candidatus Coatesbacteria bacterium]
MRTLVSNVRKIYLFRFAKFSYFHVPIIIIFYGSRGVGFAEAMVLQAVYYAAKVASEAPTGAVADRISRKFSLFLAALASGAGYLVIFLSHNFWAFAAGEVIAGIGISLASGADSALAYDTLQAEGEEKRYASVEGMAYGARLLAFAFSGIFGGLLAEFDLAWPFAATVAACAVAAGVALTLREPQRVTEELRPRYFEILKQSLKLLVKNREISWLTIYSAGLFAGIRLAFWVYQPFMEGAGFPYFAFGLTFAGLNLFSAVVSTRAGPIERFFGEKKTLVFMPILLAVGFFLMSIRVAPWAVAFILFQQVPYALFEPVLKAYSNRHIGSEIRATVLSFQSMAGNLTFVAVGPLLGLAVDYLPLNHALVIMGAVVLVFFGPVLVTKAVKRGNRGRRRRVDV